MPASSSARSTSASTSAGSSSSFSLYRCDSNSALRADAAAIVAPGVRAASSSASRSFSTVCSRSIARSRSSVPGSPSAALYKVFSSASAWGTTSSAQNATSRSRRSWGAASWSAARAIVTTWSAMVRPRRSWWSRIARTVSCCGFAADVVMSTPSCRMVFHNTTCIYSSGMEKLETRGRPRPRARVAAHRLPLLAGALPALAAGLWGALALLGLDVPLPRASFARQHGALMAPGFLGPLISLRRAVALGRPWAYAAPALAGTGGLAAAIGLTLPGKFLLTAAGGWLIAIYVAVLGRRTGRDLAVQLSGAVAWYAGALLWLGGRSVSEIVPWLAAFLILTIAGERLELARVAFLGRRASDGLLVAAALVGAGAAVSTAWPDPGWR